MKAVMYTNSKAKFLNNGKKMIGENSDDTDGNINYLLNKVLIRNNELPEILCLINNYLHETQGEYPSNEKVLWILVWTFKVTWRGKKSTMQ